MLLFFSLWFIFLHSAMYCYTAAQVMLLTSDGIRGETRDAKPTNLQARVCRVSKPGGQSARLQ